MDLIWSPFSADMELRSASRELAGVAVPYNERGAVLAERIAPGAFGGLSRRSVSLTHDHDFLRMVAMAPGGMELVDDADKMQVRATIPETDLGDELIARIASGELTGLSVGWRSSTAEYRMIDNLSELIKADLFTVGVVREAEYRTDVEMRSRRVRWLL